MAAPSKGKKEASAAGDKSQINSHGTSDELELMRLILAENKGLFNRVLDKIRAVRADGKKGVFDDVKAKMKVEESEPKKG
jgi:hypothetical protein